MEITDRIKELGRFRASELLLNVKQIASLTSKRARHCQDADGVCACALGEALKLRLIVARAVLGAAARTRVGEIE